jgi:hypothetical protein
MPRDSMPPGEVTSMEVVQVREKNDFPGQRRNYNYVVRVSTADVETGEPLMVNEYRTYASDRVVSSETVITRMTEIIEASLENL